MASKENTVLTGQLKRWNEGKGFGFISTGDDQRDIFIHISDLKGMSRRPLVGDTIYYQEQVQDDGKNRAINARIEGVELIKHHNSGNPQNNTKAFLLTAVTVTILVVVLALI